MNSSQLPFSSIPFSDNPLAKPDQVIARKNEKNPCALY